MKRYSILINTLLAVLFSIAANAQNEYNNWHFGYNSALNFSTGSPVNVAGSMISAWEGVSTISDSAGNLLFYTDGSSVYNSLNIQMPNGSGLYGGWSSTQAALIVKDPGIATEYYIFTTAEQLGSNGFCYSKVDMTLDGGLGDVYELNTQLLTYCDEKLCGVQMADGSGYWIIVRVQPYYYYAYPVTASGVGTPVISTSPFGSTTTVIGQMKISHDAKHFVSCMDLDHVVEIGDFNDTTGVLSNSFIYDTGAAGAYGAEFSPNSKRLYLSSEMYPDVKQLDMAAGNSTAILASVQTIYNSSSGYGGGMQLAPDNKIYMTHWMTQKLGVVNDPDSLSSACNYVDDAFTLAGNCNGGLPGFIVNPIESTSILPQASFTSDQNICENTCIDFTNQSTNSSSYEWIFDGGSPNTSTATNPNVCYAAAGSYDVTLISSNGSDSDTLTLTNYIIVTSATAPTITQSNDTLFSSIASSYQWYQDGNLVSGATNSFFVAPTSGLYTVEITDANGCAASTSVNIELFQQPTASIQPFVTKICPDSCIAFGSNSTNAVTYEWYFDGGNPDFSTDESPTGICYATSGNYDVTLIVHNGPYSDTAIINNLIEVYPAPSPTITQSNDTLSVLPIAGGEYQWQLGGNNITGATNEFYIATTTGNYSVIVTNGVGCTGSDQMDVIIIGVETIVSENDFVIYPNPADESLTIRLGRNKEVELRLYNTLGQLIKNDTFDKLSTGLVANHTTIDLSHFASGVYYIILQSENDLVAKKLVVSHRR